MLPTDVALPWVVAEGHPVEAAEIVLSPDLAVAEFGWQLDDLGLDPADPVGGIGVGGLPIGDLSAGGVLHPIEGAEDVGHLLGVIAGAGHVAETEIVGLSFVVAAELEEEHLEPGGGIARVGAKILAGRGGDAETELGELLLAHLFHRVAGRDMADLVTEHRDQLGLGVEMAEDSAGDVDIAAGVGERVDQRIVEDVEGPGKMGALRRGSELLAEVVDIGLPLLVRILAERRENLGFGLAAHGDLLGLAHEGELAFAGGGVEGAGAQADKASHCGDNERDADFRFHCVFSVAILLASVLVPESYDSSPSVPVLVSVTDRWILPLPRDLSSSPAFWAAVTHCVPATQRRPIGVVARGLIERAATPPMARRRPAFVAGRNDLEALSEGARSGIVRRERRAESGCRHNAEPGTPMGRGILRVLVGFGLGCTTGWADIVGAGFQPARQD